MLIGLGIGLPFASAISLAAQIAALFAAGEQGVWYDPADFSTLFQDPAGTTPVTAVGQPVGKILDKSGRGNHATQATSTKRPLLQQDATGRYYLAFDGVDDALVTGSIDFSSTDKMTLHLGMRKNSAATSLPLESSPSFNGINGGYGLVFNDAAPSDYFGFQGVGEGALLGKFSNAAPNTSVITASMSQSATTNATRLTTRKNGAAQSLTYQSALSVAGNFANSALWIGSRAGSLFPSDMYLYSLIIRGAQSTDAQIAAAEAFCNQRTGAY